MRVIVSGSTGLIGRALVAKLTQGGHTITPMVRPGSVRKGILWDPENGRIDMAALEGHDAAVHLAGESIAGLWTSGKRQRIRESRTKGTTLLATSLGKLQRPPAVFISASAVGYYGNRAPDQALDETAARGSGFLAEVVEEWEAAASLAKGSEIRVATPRFGLVLSGKGGALAPMLPVFKAGLGGQFGSGKQIWSWVALDDVAGAIVFMLTNATLAGPINVVAPNPVSNMVFTRTLGRVLRRPTVFTVPGLILKTIGGEMADELLLWGARVVPRKLLDAGYAFEYKELEGALRHVLETR